MRAVINAAQVERNRKISHILFFAWPAWGQDSSSRGPARLVDVACCFVLPILLFMTLMSVRMANT